MATITPSPTLPTSLDRVGEFTSIQAAPSTRPNPSPIRLAVLVMAITIALVFGATTALLAAGGVQFGAAVGLGAYLAFWLGGGFGLIVSSAFIFGGHD